MAKFKAGESGNIKGRPRKANGQFRKTKEMLAAERDLNRSKLFYRSILNDRLDVLEAEFAVKSVTLANKMEAVKQLNQMAREDIKQGAADLELQAEMNKKVKSSASACPATFSPVVSQLKAV
ncbi:hypothetical protein [Rahnella aceris]|uniref:hypothetical protein n=1 Tax=Rahnella sp. (strain Y9602) TaxID=2703885 RepID=UPI003BA226F4